MYFVDIILSYEALWCSNILSYTGTRAAYNKVLKGRKAAAIRARESSAKTQKLKSDLQRREREASDAKNHISDAAK